MSKLSNPFKAAVTGAAIGLGFGGAAASGDPIMFETCEMQLTTLAHAKAPPLTFEVVGARQLCVDPDAVFSPWDHTARLQVTNPGPGPVTLSHADGALARNAFANTAITEQLSGRASPPQDVFRRGGPIDPEKAKTTELVLQPGQAVLLGGDPTYVMDPLNAARDGTDLQGAPVPDADRWLRAFSLKFEAAVTVQTPQGPRQLTPDFTVPLTIMVKPPQP